MLHTEYTSTWQAISTVKQKRKSHIQFHIICCRLLFSIHVLSRSASHVFEYGNSFKILAEFIDHIAVTSTPQNVLCTCQFFHGKNLRNREIQLLLRLKFICSITINFPYGVHANAGSIIQAKTQKSHSTAYHLLPSSIQHPYSLQKCLPRL